MGIRDRVSNSGTLFHRCLLEFAWRRSFSKTRGEYRTLILAIVMVLFIREKPHPGSA